MRIVLVSARFPWPLDKGDRLTIYHMLRLLSARGHKVSLVCFLEPGQKPALDKVAPFCKRVEIVPHKPWRAVANCLLGIAGRTPLQILYYRDPGLRRALDRIVREEDPDVLYAQLIRVAPYIEPYRDRARIAAFNLSMTLNHRRLADHTSGRSKLGHLLEYRKMLRFESEYARRFDCVLYISEHDIQAIKADPPLDNVMVIPHGVDHHYFSSQSKIDEIPNSLVITGNMGYAANVDAVLYLYKDILPRVREQVPDVRLAIVGADPAPEIRALDQDETIQITGRVADIREYMNRAQVGVAPIRVGAGLQNKVLEGLSMGMPMVITSVANEGIQARPGESVLVGDTAAAFADHVVALLADPARRKALGAAARDFIVRKWTWEVHFERLEQRIVEIVQRSRASHNAS